MKKAIAITVIFCIIFFIGYPLELLISASKGLTLWYTAVLPTLFPFSVCISILSQINFDQYIGEKFHYPIKKVFGISSVASFPFFMGLLAGFPTGGKITADLYNKKLISTQEAQCILSFCNNSGPIFIIVTVGTLFLQNKNIGYLLLFSTVFANIINGIVFCKILKPKPISKKSIAYEKHIKPPTLGEILKESILSSSNLLVLVGGYIVLFSIIIHILTITNAFGFLQDFTGFGEGIFEITTGINTLGKTSLPMNIKVILSSFLLSLGGLSIQLQILSMVHNVPFSRPIYVISQLSKAIISTIISGILFNFLLK